MKPPTPEMMKILGRYMRQHGSATWLINPDVRAELEDLELIERDPDTMKPGRQRHYILTSAGRHVLAEQTGETDDTPQRQSLRETGP